MNLIEEEKMESIRKMLPTREEVEKFCREIIKKEYPRGYTFRFVQEKLPLSINVARKEVIISFDMMQKMIKLWIDNGFDWKLMIVIVLQHEKGHIRTVHEEEYVIALGKTLDLESIKAMSVSNTIADWIIDEIYYRDNQLYREAMTKDQKITYEEIYKRLSYDEKIMYSTTVFDIYATVAMFYAKGIATEEEIRTYFPEKENFILEFAKILKSIISKKDISTAAYDIFELYLRGL